MRYILLALLGFMVMSCEPKRTNECDSYKGKAVLVAYRVAKHSHMWLENPANGQVYDIGSLGGRRIPNIELGDTIDVEYCKCVEPINFDSHKYVNHAGGMSTHRKALPGY